MNQNSKESGSFATGFMLGIFAGAAGYFAFGTKRGTTLRKRLQDEWLSAQEHLAQTNIEEHSATQKAQSVFSQAKHLIENALSSFDVLDSHEVEQEKKVAKKKRTRSSRFRGVK